MRIREHNTDRTGRRGRRDNHRKNGHRRGKRMMILAVLCLCILGILEWTAKVYLEGKNEKETVTVTKTASTEKATLQTVDKEKLLSLITDTEQINKSVYTAESLAVLEQNIENARNAVNGSCTQAELDNYYVSIVKVIQGLKRSDEIATDMVSESSTEQAATELDTVRLNTLIGLQ